MDRAYSLLEIKSVDDDLRQITGMASTPSPDRIGDEVDPKGAQFSLPMPFLWQHDHDSPIGKVISAVTTEKGIEIVAQIAKNVTQEIDVQWAKIKSGLVGGLSIGFRVLDAEPIKGSRFGQKIKEWELYEVSAVTIPMNSETTITSIKKFDGNW